MSYWKLWIFNNFKIWSKHLITSIFLILFPVIVLVWLSFPFKNELIWLDYKDFNHNPIEFNWHKKSQAGQWEVDCIRTIFTDKTVGIVYNITSPSNLINYNKNTFEKYITNETTGICLKSKNCTWKEIKHSWDYWNNGSTIWESFHLDLNNGNPQYKLYTSILSIYLRENQISEWYINPSKHGDYIYSQALQVYFAKYLIEITRDANKDLAGSKEINISLYPMWLAPEIKIIGSDNYTNVMSYFILLNGAFFSIVILLIELWAKKKIMRITDLLKYQGVSMIEYILAWFITYLIVNIIPITLFIICFTILWINLTWKYILILTGMVVLNYINYFVFCICSISFINKNNGSKLWIYASFWLMNLWYYMLWEIQENFGILKYFFHCIPNISFTLCLKQIFLLSNYKAGGTVSWLFAIHEDINFFLILMENITCLVLWVIVIIIIERDWCSSKNRKSWKKLIRGKNEIVKIKDNTNPTIMVKTNLERCFEWVSDLHFTQQLENNECLRIQNIVKKFGEYIAVNNISLEWFKGQIFVLLGHNGAGKTTLLNIISGNMEVDQGDILWEGHSLIEDQEFFNSNISVCRQEDIYYPDLTVYEQIELFSKLKGNNKDNKTEVINLITWLGWKEYADLMPSSLSGGNWRKLSVAFTWLGNSKLVILDEPTTGMDFISKKLFWDFLKTVKQNRIIIITTHSMDEAEYWGDNIGIMTEGELICRGSSSFLKRKYPCGFNINFVFLSNSITFKEKSDLINKLRAIEPGMTIKVLSKDWIKLNFPESSFREDKTTIIFNTIEQLKNIYKIKDYTVSTTSLEEVFFKVNDVDFARNWFETELEDIIKTISQETKTGGWLILDEKTQQYEKQQHNEIDYTHCYQNSFSNDAFDFPSLDRNTLNNRDSINIWNSQSKTNLQCFLAKSTVENHKNLSTIIESIPEKVILTNNQIWKHFKRNFLRFYRYIFSSLAQFFICLVILIIVQIIFQVLFNIYIFHLNTIWNLFPKRIQTVYSIVNKDQTNLTTKTINELVDVYESSFSFNKWNLQIDSYNPINYSNISYNTDFGINKNYLLVEYDNTAVNYINFYSLSSPDITHAMLNCILRKYLFEEYSITTFLFEGYADSSLLLISVNKSTLKSNYLLLTLLSTSHLIFSLFCHSISFNDNKSEMKVLIKISTEKIYKYWVGLFLFDYMKFWILTIIIYSYLYFTLPSSLYLLPFSLLFGINIIILAYLFIYFFISTKSTKLTYLVINFIAIVWYYTERDLLPNIETVHDFFLCDLLPITSMLHYFYDIQMHYMLIIVAKNKESFEFTILYITKLKIAFCHFFIQFLIICLLLCELETKLISKILYIFLSTRVKSWSKGSKEKQLYNMENEEEREWNSDSSYNIIQDNSNMLTCLILNDCSINPETEIKEMSKKEIYKETKNPVWHLSNISVTYKKKFSKNILGVDKINLELEPNERFALMGLNNAGKSTIIKTILNIISYEKGFIKFNNHILPKDFDIIKKDIGYCPEENSLFPYLTVFETFDYYYNGEFTDTETPNSIENNKSNYSSNSFNESTFNGKRKKYINSWIQTYGLSNYTNVLTMNLSGGNKRKLLFAIALMNNPKLALLDEPSTGVDPDSRRLMWKNLSSIQRKNRALGNNFNWILSTQSIEEAEILCDNLGLLKKGTFAYLGNSENWKMQLSEGYYLKICFKKPWINDINDNFSIYENPFLSNLDDVEGISALNIDRIKKEKNIEMLYYLFYWHEICCPWLENKTKISFIDYIENSFRLILTIQNNKAYIFSNLWNMKNIHQNISELTLSIQPFDTFIDNL